jgi:hypothetical protein
MALAFMKRVHLSLLFFAVALGGCSVQSVKPGYQAEIAISENGYRWLIVVPDSVPRFTPEDAAALTGAWALEARSSCGGALFGAPMLQVTWSNDLSGLLANPLEPSSYAVYTAALGTFECGIYRVEAAGGLENGRLYSSVIKAN